MFSTQGTFLITAFSYISLADAKKTYNISKAPPHLKLTRFTLSVLSIGHYTFLCGYSLYTLGKAGLSHLLVSGNPAYIIFNLPQVFVASFSALEIIKMIYRINMALYNPETIGRLKDISQAIIECIVMTAILLTPFLLQAPLPYMLGFKLICLYMLWHQLKILSDELYRIYEHTYILKIEIKDLEYIITQILTKVTISISLIFLILSTTTTGLNIAFILLGLLSAVSGSYVMCKSIADIYYDYSLCFNLTQLQNITIALIQQTLGLSLIAGPPILKFILSCFVEILITWQAEKLINNREQQKSNIAAHVSNKTPKQSDSIKEHVSDKYHSGLEAKQLFWSKAPKEDSVPQSINQGDRFNV